MEHLCPVDKVPPQLGLVPVVGRLVDGHEHVPPQPGQHVGDDLALGFGVHRRGSQQCDGRGHQDKRQRLSLYETASGIRQRLKKNLSPPD